MTMLRIAMVTPSYNQAPFLDVCIGSVLAQNYPNLDYRVYDGGSNDGSVEIIRRHADRLTDWRSGADDGPYAAINEAFENTNADVLGWLNSDDMLLPGALLYVAEVFTTFPEVQWMTTLTPGMLNGAGDLTSARIAGVCREGWLDGRHLGITGLFRTHGFVQQESTFFRRSLWQSAGGLRKEYPLAGDFDLWSRFFERSEIAVTGRMIGAFRSHLDNRSKAIGQYLSEAAISLSETRERLSWKHRPIRGNTPSFTRLLGTHRTDRINFFWGYRRLEIRRTSDAVASPMLLTTFPYL